MTVMEERREWKYFDVDILEYDKSCDFHVFRGCTLENPRNNSVTFITEANIGYKHIFDNVEKCLIFWPEKCEIPNSIKKKNLVLKCENPHLEYCLFFRKYKIDNYVPLGEIKFCEGGYACSHNVRIGDNVCIFPFVLLNGNIHIGNNVYLGAGVKIIGDVYIGDNVVIKENSVIGSDGLSTDRDGEEKAATMPQFGGVIIEDDVQIGANTTIARGAIDDTIIRKRTKIDSNCYISHNANIGEDVFIVGETMLFGSVTVENKAYISGNCTVKNGLTIEENAFVGMGTVVSHNVKANQTLYRKNIERYMPKVD